MCSPSKEQSILSRETIQNACFFFSELCPYFDLDFVSSIKHPTAKRWHQNAVLLFSKIAAKVHIFMYSLCSMNNVTKPQLGSKCLAKGHSNVRPSESRSAQTRDL